MPDLQSLAEYQEKVADNTDSWGGPSEKELNDPKNVFKNPETQQVYNEKEQVKPIKRWKLPKFNVDSYFSSLKNNKPYMYKSKEEKQRDIDQLIENERSSPTENRRPQGDYGEDLNNFMENQTNPEYRADQLEYLKVQHRYQMNDMNDRIKNASTQQEKLALEKEKIKLQRQQSDEVRAHNRQLTMDKTGKVLSSQFNRLSMPKINRPRAWTVAGMNKSFVRPYASETSGQFTLTKGSRMAVDTGGFDTQDEFKRNNDVQIYVPQARSAGSIRSKGSLSVNMGVVEKPVNMGVRNAVESQQTDYEIPSGLRNFARTKAFSNSLNRANERNNMRNDFMQFRPIEPTFLDEVLINSRRITEDRSMKLSKEVGQERVNYSKMTGNPQSASREVIQRYGGGSGVSTIRQPQYKMAVKDLDLKTTGKPQTSYKTNKISLKPIKLKHIKTKTQHHTVGGISNSIKNTINLNTIKKKISKRK